MGLDYSSGCVNFRDIGAWINYKGFLTFESKTELTALYEKKYGAMLAAGQRMFIPPQSIFCPVAKATN